jgi:hypothetical protein
LNMLRLHLVSVNGRIAFRVERVTTSGISVHFSICSQFANVMQRLV